MISSIGYPDISIILPGIRKENWMKLYQSVFQSVGKYSFEFIIVGPHCPEDELINKSNVKWIESFRSPVACQNIAIEKAEGQYIVWVSDDGVFVPNKSLEESIDYLDYIDDPKTVCVFNYTEAENIVEDKHLKLINSYPKAKYINPEFYIFNIAVMNTDYLKSLGGYDCRFEATAVSHADLAMRAQLDGCSVRLFNKPMLSCTWTPGTSGDHAPVHFRSDRKR